MKKTRRNERPADRSAERRPPEEQQQKPPQQAAKRDDDESSFAQLGEDPGTVEPDGS